MFKICYKYRYLLIALSIYSLNIFAKALPIIQRPIVFDDTRIAETKKYRQQHYGITSSDIVIKPKLIVIHWTETKTLEQAFNIFNPAILQGRSELENASVLNVSAHFLIDRDGTIYQLMPTNWMSRSVIGLNNIAISIENVGGPNESPKLTEKQLRSNAALVRKLLKLYPEIQYLIGHHEYLYFRDTPLWLEKTPIHYTSKNDPGDDIMTDLRYRLKSRYSQ